MSLFRELQVVHDTGYFSSDVSPEEDWEQVIYSKILLFHIRFAHFSKNLIRYDAVHLFSR